MSDDDRIRWHCRRGLLELDLNLHRFLQSRFLSLTQAERATFARLLAHEDGDLWDLISGRITPTDSDEASMLSLLQEPNNPRASKGL